MNLDIACNHFRALLEEQLARVDRLKNAPAPVNFSKLDKIIVGVMGGDGIGPMITSASVKVMEVLLQDEISAGKIEFRDIPGLTIENRMAKNQAVPDEVLAAAKECHVLLKGPTTTPNGGTMGSANVGLRKALDLYANVRPISVPELGIDWTFFRENTEGEYAVGSSGVELPDLACDFKIITDPGTERIARMAYEFARNNGKKRVTIVTKANIMKKTDGKFSDICHRIASEYPEIETEECYIDIMTANLVNENRRSDFQVMVLPNLYGDIITDEAAQIQGGVGSAGSANIGDLHAMFEAIHGSAPRMVERGDGDYANPLSMMNACELMLRHIGFVSQAERLSNALSARTMNVAGRKGGVTCAQFTDHVISLLS